MTHNGRMGLLTVEQVAERLNVGPFAVRRRIRAGELPAVNIGTKERPRWRVDEATLNQWLKDRGLE